MTLIILRENLNNIAKRTLTVGEQSPTCNTGSELQTLLCNATYERMKQMKKIGDHGKDWGFYEETRKKFNEDYNLSLKINQPFNELITTVLNEKGGKYPDIFCEKTGYDPRMFTRIREKDYIPNMKTLMTLCMAFDLDMLIAVTLLESVGRTFHRRNKVHYAYCHLLVNYRGKTIEECNKVLKALGVEDKYLLGTRSTD